MVEAIGAMRGRYFNPVDAVKLYTNTQNSHAVQAHAETANPFKNTVSMLGLYQQQMDGNIGTFNGQPPAEYNEFGEEVPRTLCIFG